MKDSYIKVLHYIPNVDRTYGGTTAYMQLLASELGKLTELHIVTHHSLHPVEICNSCIHYLPDFKSVCCFKKDWLLLLDTIKPDIVHVNCCWFPGCAMVQKWAQRHGYKVILTPHGMLEPWIIKRHYWSRKLPALWLYQKSAIKAADCLHATAESEKDNLLKLGYNSRIEVIPNGIEIEHISIKPSWRRTKNILFLSRIHIKKGINFLIEAIAILKDELKDYQINIAGEGEKVYIDELLVLAKALGVNDRIHFIGGVYGEQKWKLFRDADVFVLPTHSENFGIVIAEALACGTPVITTEGTPWHELETYHCGWWTKIGVQATVEALRKFLTISEDELELMGKNGRMLVEGRYSSKKMAESMVVLYKKVLNDGK